MGRLAPSVAAIRLAVRAVLDGPVLVACSGGADSLALAAATAFVAPRVGVPAGLVTVDHGLQAGSAEVAARNGVRQRVYVRVTWVWISVFVLRLLVQGPLYLADAVGALGVARLFMGFPLFGLAAYVTWVLVRRVPATRPEDVTGR